MSQMAPEAAAPAPVRPSADGQPAGGGNILTRKIGPLPTWAWIVIVLAVILGIAYWRNRSSSSSTTATGTDASQVPQFVNQTYVSPTPPAAPGTIAVPPITNGSGGGSTNTGGGTGSTPGPLKPPLKPDTRYSEAAQRNTTLGSFAKNHHWSAAFLAQVEKLNNLKPGSRVKKGQRLIVPA